jgi:hypothetical protein
VTYGGRDIPACGTAVGAVAHAQTWPVSCDRHTAIAYDGMPLPTWATAVDPSVVGHGGNRPPAAVPYDARNLYLYNVGIQPKEFLDWG